MIFFFCFYGNKAKQGNIIKTVLNEFPVIFLNFKRKMGFQSFPSLPLEGHVQFRCKLNKLENCSRKNNIKEIYLQIFENPSETNLEDDKIMCLCFLIHLLVYQSHQL